jgi:hypothetical protein
MRLFASLPFFYGAGILVLTESAVVWTDSRQSGVQIEESALTRPQIDMIRMKFVIIWHFMA